MMDEAREETCNKSSIPEIRVAIPAKFLELFDEKTSKQYTSRSEAIRRGMTLVLRETNELRETT